MKLASCSTCHAAFELPSHPGRPPTVCSPACRRIARTALERRRIAAQKAEVARLRSLVDQFKAVALAA